MSCESVARQQVRSSEESTCIRPRSCTSCLDCIKTCHFFCRPDKCRQHHSLQAVMCKLLLLALVAGQRQAQRFTCMIVSLRRMTLTLRTVKAVPSTPQAKPTRMAGPTAATWFASWVCTCSQSCHSTCQTRVLTNAIGESCVFSAAQVHTVMSVLRHKLDCDCHRCQHERTVHLWKELNT